jgi:flagellar hook assembly protein FlgD
VRGAAALAYELPAPGVVSLAVFDVQGHRVRTLAAGTHAAGRHRVSWEGRDESGREVASGLYFVRLESGGEAEVRRLTWLR